MCLLPQLVDDVNIDDRRAMDAQEVPLVQRRIE
jgi:hypothetical protein